MAVDYWFGFDDPRPMRTIVRSLRIKLGDDAANPAYIFTEPPSAPECPGARGGEGSFYPLHPCRFASSE